MRICVDPQRPESTVAALLGVGLAVGVLLELGEQANSVVAAIAARTESRTRYIHHSLHVGARDGRTAAALLEPDQRASNPDLVRVTETTVLTFRS